MSFKGRIETTGEISGSVNGIFASGGVMFNVTDVNGVHIEPGMTVKITYIITSMAFPFGFAESDGGSAIPTAIIGVVDGTTGTIAHVIQNASADGVCAFAVAAGNHVFTYTVEIIRVIDNPISALKHVKQLQNWSEIGVVANWGKDLIHEALIKAGGEGSFYNTSLDEIRSLKIARQLFDYGVTWTDDLAQAICYHFFLVSYQDAGGFECVKSLLTKENPSTVVTFGDIVGRVGAMVPVPASHIYCAPVINYGYDYATETFTGQLSIGQVWNDEFDIGYTSGLNADDALELWIACHKLWSKTHQIEPMPQRLSDNYWACDYDTAVWCLRQLIKLMSIKRCSFNLPYTIARKWTASKHFMLELPHQTDGGRIECVVESISKSKQDNRVSVTVILLDKIESSFFF